MKNTNTTISKANLITGDMIVTANGKAGTVLKDTVCGDIIRFHTEFNSFSYLSSFNEDLTHKGNERHDTNHNLDIVAVYRTFDSDRSKVGGAIANPDKMICNGNLIYLRPSISDEETESDSGTDDGADSDTDSTTVSFYEALKDLINSDEFKSLMLS